MSLEESNSWDPCCGYLVFASCGANHSCGTAILFRPGIPTESRYMSDISGMFRGKIILQGQGILF